MISRADVEPTDDATDGVFDGYVPLLCDSCGVDLLIETGDPARDQPLLVRTGKYDGVTEVVSALRFYCKAPCGDGALTLGRERGEQCWAEELSGWFTPKGFAIQSLQQILDLDAGFLRFEASASRARQLLFVAAAQLVLRHRANRQVDTTASTDLDGIIRSLLRT